MDVDDVRATTHGTVFDVLLIDTCRHVNRNDNYFATGITDVGGIVLHVLLFHSFDDAQFRVRWNDP